MAFSKGRYLSGVLGLSVPIVWVFNHEANQQDQLGVVNGMGSGMSHS